jgi:hypothetical protein
VSAQESESPWLIDYLRMRAVNTTLSPAEARAVATLYDTAIAQRDAAVHQIKIAKVCNDSQAELIERLTLEKRQTFDEINDLRAKLAAAVRERTECVAREQRWRARRAACYRVVEAAERFRSHQGTASEGEKYAALNNALDAYCATYIEHFFASQRPSVDDDYGPNDGYARTVNRTPTPPQEATNDDA